MVARKLVLGLPAHVAARFNVVCFPQIGYLIAIPHGFENDDCEYVGDGWDFRFSTSTTSYYKSSEMADMDDSWGDMHSAICGKVAHLS